MAYRRSIIARTKLFYQQQQRLASSFSHIRSIDREELPPKTISVNSEIRSRFLITRNYGGSSLLSGNVSGLMRSNIPAGHGLLFHRNYSEVPSDFEVLYDGGGDLNGVMGAVGDKAVEAAAPVVNEAAVAAADSGFQYLIYNADFLVPVAAFQYLIDCVHCYAGFQWWASIAVTTLLFRSIMLPVLIHHLKFHSKVLPVGQLLEVAIKATSTESTETEKKEAKAFMSNIREKFGPNQELGLKIAYISPLFWFLAILNMAEKVPSFVTGGTLWFTDLTTPDHSMYLPVLLALTMWIRMKLDPLHHVISSSTKMNLKKYYAAGALSGAVKAVLPSVIIVAAELPSAIYCYAITSNLFSIAFAIVMMDPRVPKLLGISPPTDK